MLTQKFGLRKESPEDKKLSREAESSIKSAKQIASSASEMATSREWTLLVGSARHEARRHVGLHGRERLESKLSQIREFFFFKFVTGLIRPELIVSPWV